MCVFFGGILVICFLYFIWICDKFGFMLVDGKIDLLNKVICLVLFSM